VLQSKHLDVHQPRVHQRLALAPVSTYKLLMRNMLYLQPYTSNLSDRTPAAQKASLKDIALMSVCLKDIA